MDRKEYKQWFCLETKYQQEDKVELSLKNVKGFETLVPREIYEGKIRPMFPGYMFVSFDPSMHNWQRCHYTPGVKRLIMVREKPVSVSAKTIEMLQAITYRDKEDIRPRYVQGQNVVFIDGPFKRFAATIQATTDRSALLMVWMFGKPQEVEASLGSIQAA